MPQAKDTEWLNGYGNKTHINAAYKRPTSDLRIRTNWKSGNEERYSTQMGIKKKKKKTGSSNINIRQVDFKIKIIGTAKERYYIMIKGSIQKGDIAT